MNGIDLIIRSNPSVYNLRFESYENGKVVFTKPSELAMKDIEKDLKLFEERQEAIYKRTQISMGDYLIKKDGSISRITVIIDDLVQDGGHENGSFYIGKNGFCSYSGTCGNIINLKNYVLTNEYREGLCWIFSNDWTGPHRGVSNRLKFKVLREI